MRNKIAHGISILVIILFALYYFVLKGFPTNLGFLNAVIAFSSTFLIGFSFILGPLARFIKPLRKDLLYRKVFGLWGFALAVIHASLSVLVILEQPSELILADAASLAFAAMALIIFLLMALTSTNEWIAKLGPKNWKSLQRTGYLAFLFVLFHIFLLGGGVFLSRETGHWVIAFSLLLLFLRAIVIILKKPSEQKYDLLN